MELTKYGELRHEPGQVQKWTSVAYMTAESCLNDTDAGACGTTKSEVRLVHHEALVTESVFWKLKNPWNYFLETRRQTYLTAKEVQSEVQQRSERDWGLSNGRKFHRYANVKVKLDNTNFIIHITFRSVLEFIKLQVSAAWPAAFFIGWLAIKVIQCGSFGTCKHIDDGSRY